MTQDQTTILQKLQSGEISLEEAERLLAELDTAQADSESDPAADEAPRKQKPEHRHEHHQGPQHGQHRHHGEHHQHGGRPDFPFGGGGPFGRGRFNFGAWMRPPMPPAPPTPPTPIVPPGPPFSPEDFFAFGNRGRKRGRGRHMNQNWEIRTSELVAALQRLGITEVEESELEDLRNHGVTPNYIYELSAIGVRDLNVQSLIELRNHGVKSDYIAQMVSLGMASLTAEEWIELRDHGVRADLVHVLARYGLHNLPISTLVDLTNHGVSAGYIYRLHEYGINNFTPEEIIELADHGVRPRYIHALGRAGLGDLPVDEIIELVNHGVSPDYISEVRRTGLNFSPSEFVELVDHGVKARYIYALVRLGMTELSVDKIIEMTNEGIKPEMVAQLRGSGRGIFRGEKRKRGQQDSASAVEQLSNLLLEVREGRYDDETLGTLEALGIAQFSEAFTQEMRDLGYEELSPQQLVDMWVFDIDADYLRGIESEGEQPSMDEIIEIRRVELQGEEA